MALTSKQEKFCQCIVSGMDGVTAYRTAYNTQAKTKTCNNEARILLKRDDITERITELRKPVINHAQNIAINEQEKIKALAWERIAECEANGDDNAIARYMDILNKMNGTYVNITKSVDEHKTEIINLDTDTLKRLSNAQ